MYIVGLPEVQKGAEGTPGAERPQGLHVGGGLGVGGSGMGGGLFEETLLLFY